MLVIGVGSDTNGWILPILVNREHGEFSHVSQNEGNASPIVVVGPWFQKFEKLEAAKFPLKKTELLAKVLFKGLLIALEVVNVIFIILTIVENLLLSVIFRAMTPYIRSRCIKKGMYWGQNHSYLSNTHSLIFFNKRNKLEIEAKVTIGVK